MRWGPHPSNTVCESGMRSVVHFVAPPVVPRLLFRGNLWSCAGPASQLPADDSRNDSVGNHQIHKQRAHDFGLEKPDQNSEIKHDQAYGNMKIDQLVVSVVECQANDRA